VSLLLKKLDHQIDTKGKFMSPRISNKLIRNILVVAMLAVVFYLSINFVLTGSDEGLIYLTKRQQEAKKEWRQVLDLTENDSIIITLYHDKLLFPERKVIVGLFNDQNMNQVYAKLVNELPVYYYNFNFPDKDFEYLNNTRLPSVGLQIRKIQAVNDKFTLYELFKKSTTTEEIINES
jgi:hypothetical protein